MYSFIIDYGSCLDYVYINLNSFVEILCVILELYYLDYKFIVVYLLF